MDTEDEVTDPYIVEKIVDKPFNPHKSQHEYLVKWLGYDMKENTCQVIFLINNYNNMNKNYYTKTMKVSLENVA